MLAIGTILVAKIDTGHIVDLNNIDFIIPIGEKYRIINNVSNRYYIEHFSGIHDTHNLTISPELLNEIFANLFTLQVQNYTGYPAIPNGSTLTCTVERPSIEFDLNNVEYYLALGEKFIVESSSTNSSFLRVKSLVDSTEILILPRKVIENHFLVEIPYSSMPYYNYTFGGSVNISHEMLTAYASTDAQFGLTNIKFTKPKNKYAKAEKFLVTTDIDNSGDSKKEFNSLRPAKAFLKGRCGKGFINILQKGRWIRAFEYDAEIGFRRSVSSIQGADSFKYVRFS